MHELEKIPLGDLKGKTFSEVTLDQLDSLISWLERKKMHKSWNFGEFYEKAVEYLELNHHGPKLDHQS